MGLDNPEEQLVFDQANLSQSGSSVAFIQDDILIANFCIMKVSIKEKAYRIS